MFVWPFASFATAQDPSPPPMNYPAPAPGAPGLDPIAPPPGAPPAAPPAPPAAPPSAPPAAPAGAPPAAPAAAPQAPPAAEPIAPAVKSHTGYSGMSGQPGSSMFPGDFDCSAPGPKFWFGTEYLRYTIKDGPVPGPLVTSGTTGVAGA